TDGQRNVVDRSEQHGRPSSPAMASCMRAIGGFANPPLPFVSAAVLRRLAGTGWTRIRASCAQTVRFGTRSDSPRGAYGGPPCDRLPTANLLPAFRRGSCAPVGPLGHEATMGAAHSPHGEDGAEKEKVVVSRDRLFLQRARLTGWMLLGAILLTM